MGAIPAIAQDSSAAIPTAEVVGPDFREGYRDQLSVSSSIILGLSLGTGTGLASLDQIIVDRSGMPHAGTFCLRAMSEDGLFWAENSYSHSSKSNFVRTAPVSKNHKSKLEDYGKQKILITAGFGDTSDKGSCGEANLVYAPAVDDPNVIPQNLKVFINSENRFTQAQLRTPSQSEDGAILATVNCRKVTLETAAIYDKTCTFNLDEITATDIVELKFSFSSGPFGTDEWVEKIVLPARNSP